VWAAPNFSRQTGLGSATASGAEVKKLPMQDMIILVPGITGSVLQRHGKDLWAPSGQAITDALKTLGNSLDALFIDRDDPDLDHLDDGITATRLVPRAHLVPGLHKGDGYGAVSRWITKHFEVVPGTMQDQRPANFFEYPYDWRRDNRVAARKLARFVEDRLRRWRNWTGNHGAQVILLAHSMGGLVARHFVEVLEGWRFCRALATFGTPHRGSVAALGYLVNGYKRMLLDLSDVMRSFTSTYQLLPRYEMLEVDGVFQRVVETDSIPHVSSERAREANDFHRAIEAAVKRNRANEMYGRTFHTLSVVGTGQPTLQSARLSRSGLAVSRDLPAGMDPLLDRGDGTVPRVSAIPIELSQAYPSHSFVAERHSSLQRPAILEAHLLERLVQMQATGLQHIRGPLVRSAMEGKRALSVDIDDLYLDGEPIAVKVETVGINREPQAIRADIQSISGGGPPRTVDLHPDGSAWVAQLEGLDPGLYRLTVRARHVQGGQLSPVHDIFEVARS
jgi:hypothetical protein